MGFRWLAATALAFLPACGEESRGALDAGDPLHDTPVRMPPPEIGLPPRAAPPAPQEAFPVPAPPFSEGIFPCSRCHVGGAAPAEASVAIPHKAHLDRDLECGDCHGTGAAPVIPEVSTCLECHEDPPAEPAVRKYFDATRTSDGGYAFPLRWKTRDTNPEHARHGSAGVTCDQCHGPITDAPVSKPKSVALMERCLDCHRKRSASTECAACHREIREPQHKNVVLKHGPEGRACFDCHNPDDRDTLRLISGERVSFQESYRLCGQCHGEKLRDWKSGLHGKRTGMWDGRRSYLLCVHCHQNPHAPHFPEMQPLPPPTRPEDVK